MTEKSHNNDPRYLRGLLETAGISQRQAAKLVGITDRMMRYYLDPKSRWRAPEKVVKKLEELAMSKTEVFGFVNIQQMPYGTKLYAVVDAKERA